MFWLKSIMWGLALTAATSLFLSGKLAKDPTRVLLGKTKEGKELSDNVFFMGAPGDLSSFIHNVDKYGAVVGTARMIASKFGPLVRTGVHLASNTDAVGRPIIPPRTKQDILGRSVPSHPPGVAEKTALGAEDFVKELLPVPFSITTLAGMLADPKHHYTYGQYAEAALSGRRPQVAQ